MAKLSPEIRATLSQQKEQLLALIDEAKLLEFILLDSIGENQEIVSTLEQLTEISEQARTKLSQLSTLHLRIAEVQPTISNDLLRLMNEAISNIESRIPALERSLEEIKLDWRLK
jgi:signal transduction histidine kinase